MDINVSFWNLENLFDTIDDPISNDFDFTPTEGWTAATHAAKVANLAAVIDAMFDGAGPDCSVEPTDSVRSGGICICPGGFLQVPCNNCSPFLNGRHNAGLAGVLGPAV